MMSIIFYFQFFNIFNIMYKSTIEYIIECEPIDGCIISKKNKYCSTRQASKIKILKIYTKKEKIENDRVILTHNNISREFIINSIIDMDDFPYDPIGYNGIKITYDYYFAMNNIV